MIANIRTVILDSQKQNVTLNWAARAFFFRWLRAVCKEVREQEAENCGLLVEAQLLLVCTCLIVFCRALSSSSLRALTISPMAPMTRWPWSPRRLTSLLPMKGKYLDCTSGCRVNKLFGEGGRGKGEGTQVLSDHDAWDICPQTIILGTNTILRMLGVFLFTA